MSEQKWKVVGKDDQCIQEVFKALTGTIGALFVAELGRSERYVVENESGERKRVMAHNRTELNEKIARGDFLKDD